MTTHQVQITIDPHNYVQVISGRVSWKRVSSAFYIEALAYVRGNIDKRASYFKVYDLVKDLKSSLIAQAKKDYYKNHNLYLMTIVFTYQKEN